MKTKTEHYQSPHKPADYICAHSYTTLICGIIMTLMNTLHASAYTPDIFRASNTESLSNNSVLMMAQDDKGFMWLGTYDGLNRYDGKSIRVFRYELDNPKSLSGNVINELHKAEKGFLWVLTTMGLDKFSTGRLSAEEHYSEIRGGRHTLVSDTLGHAFAISPESKFMYYDPVIKEFRTQVKPAWVGNLGYCKGVMAGNNTLWLFPAENFAYKIHFDFSGGYTQQQAHFTWQKVKLGEEKITGAFESPRGFYIVSENGNLSHHDEISRNVRLIRNIKPEIERYGKISNIVPFGNDITISFVSNGVMRLCSDYDYMPEMLFTEAGAFNLLHDRRQPLVWVATDGRGLYKMCHINSRYKSIHSTQIPDLTKPIRTFFTDSHNNLWIGTKGDGLIILSNYPTLPQEGQIPDYRITRYGKNPGTKGDLTTNQIFAIKESVFKPGRIWLAGAGPGIAYTNSPAGEITNLVHPEIIDIHDFFEASDSVLWLASSTRGLIKVVTDGNDRVLKTDTYIFRRNKHTCNEIYTLAYDGHNSLYIGCRGGIGILRFDINTGKYYTLNNINDRIPGIGDIISLAYSGDGNLYFGSSIGGGIVDCRNPENPVLTKILTSKDGLTNDMVHSIIPTGDGNVWLSTNKGLARYNTNTSILHNTSGIAGDINEFCDNSGYISPQNGDLIFGALNGIVCVKSDAENLINSDGTPTDVVFTGLSVNGSDKMPAPDIISNGLVFNHDDGVISISFAALDYITGDFINYWYKLEGQSDKWINLGTTPSVTFTNLSPGKYKLHVRCETDGEKTNTKAFVLPIQITPVWYATWYSYCLYVFVFILIITLIIYRSRYIYNIKRHELERRLYEKEQERLFADRKEFFTNITHEFCSPLTMILGMCDALKKHVETSENSKLKPYVDSLYENSKHLNELVQEILDVRYMEEDSLIHLKIQPIAIENVFKRWVYGYEEIARQNSINFIIEVEQPDLRWNTDVSCLSKIVTNLMSNAFKYTPSGGEIRVSAKQAPDGELQLSVYNTGQGISEENLKLLFNKFAVFNNVDTNGYRAMSSRHGLGLFICHEMAVKLGGDIKVDSVEGEFVRFTVTLPPMNVRQGSEEEATLTLPAENPSQLVNKPEILVVDDNPDILWLVSNILSKDYAVTCAGNGAEARASIDRQIPALIITDIMMPDENGLDFIKYIRDNKFTRNLPIIVLSAKISEEDKIEGYNAGADAYVTKPFNADFLQTLTARLLQRKNADKDYYRSSESAVTLEGGMEISNEGKLFFDNIRKYISDNLEDESKLSPAGLAEATGVDIRTLYRRFKKYTPYTPSEFVKKCRYAYGANLILTTDLTIQEIIYRIGMNNKTVFYADFKKIYGMTPKEYRNSKQ